MPEDIDRPDPQRNIWQAYNNARAAQPARKYPGPVPKTWVPGVHIETWLGFDLKRGPELRCAPGPEIEKRNWLAAQRRMLPE